MEHRCAPACRLADLGGLWQPARRGAGAVSEGAGAERVNGVRSMSVRIAPDESAASRPCVSLSVIIPVFNERHPVRESMSRVLAVRDLRSVSRIEVIEVIDVQGSVLTSIPIRSNSFGLEPEITMKIAKRHASVFEVPVSDLGRTATCIVPCRGEGS
jgi:hypothetical protein